MFWGYVIAGYGIAAVVLGTYVVSTLRRGRTLSRQLDPEQRRFLDD